MSGRPRTRPRSRAKEAASTLSCLHQIIVINEATASIDMETDALIQRTFHEAFQGCTVLIITHRVTTVLSCDRVLAMDNGRVRAALGCWEALGSFQAELSGVPVPSFLHAQVVEFDRPEVLRRKPGSMFAALLATASH